MSTSRGHQDYPLEDLEWNQGSQEGIKYARFIMDQDDPSSPVMLMTKFQPGTKVAPHTHDCNYMEYIVEGEQTVGKDLLKAGDTRVVKGGTDYGPITVGQNGCTVVAFFQDRTGMGWEAMPRKKATAG